MGYSSTWGTTRGPSRFSFRARRIREKVLGREHPDYAYTLNKLGLLYWGMGDYVQAESLMRQACDIRETSLGEEHPVYAGNLGHLGRLYQAMGDYARAEPLLQQSRDIKKKALGEENPHYAVSLHELGMLYRATGDYAQAEPLHKMAVEISAGHLEQTAAVLTEQQQMAYERKLRKYLDSYLSCLLVLESRGETAFQHVLSWKGSTLVRQRAMRIVANQPELLPLVQQLQQVTARWASWPQRCPNPNKRKPFVNNWLRWAKKKSDWKWN